MELMRATWTDSRLDDLNDRVTEIRDDVGNLRTEAAAEFRAVRGEIGSARGEIGALKRTIIQVGGGLIGTVVVGMLGLIATQL
jgi:archaellum component FlaC